MLSGHNSLGGGGGGGGGGTRSFNTIKFELKMKAGINGEWGPPLVLELKVSRL